LKVKEYNYLRKFLNQKIINYRDKVEMLSHNNLHLIREHQIFLNKYELIFIKNFLKFILNCTFRSILGFFSVFYSLRNIYQNNKFSKFTNKQDDILFVSHFLNTSILGKDDFYYGKLPEELKGKNTILYINHQKKWYTNLKPYWPLSITNRVLLSKNTNLINEFFLISKILFNFFRYLINIFFSKSILDLKINIFLMSTYFSNSTLFNLRMYYQFLYYFRKVKVRSVIFTFEGHAWERLLVLAARKSGVKKIIAYQHANISKFQNSIFTFHGIFKIDKILSSNFHGFKKLSEIYKSIELIGSLRVNRETKLNNFEVFNKKSYHSCLIVPDGILSECFLMFNFSLEAARLNKNIKFIWRLHPLITFEMLKNKINFEDLPSNIILSNNSIEKDISISSWVVYRASTAVLNAALSGLRPIYLPDKDNLQIDPLYFLNKKWKKCCSNPCSLINIINNDIKLKFKNHLNNKYLKVLENKFNQSFDFKKFKRILIESN